jgi:GTP-eEF1A C-terminal domain-like
VPLFFDSYARNRTTGSFILIDVISNATVGAAMIREDLSRSESSKPLAAHLSKGAAGAGKVTAEERRQRHGHRFAIFSVVGNRALAERLERSLFDRGLHAVLVNDEELSSTSLSSVISALREAGAVVIHTSATTSTEQRTALAERAGEFWYDIAADDQNHDEEALKRALSIAEKLRIDVAATGKGKAAGDAFTD